MTPDSSEASAFYARFHIARHRDADALTARFYVPGDPDSSRKVRVPHPKHVARHLTARALRRSDALDPATAPALTRDLLETLTERHTDGRGNDVAQWHRGLWTALNYVNPRDADGEPADFDRARYVADVVAATLTELRRDEDKAARDAELAAARLARAEARAARGPALTPAERKARFRVAHAARELDAVDTALGFELEVEPLAPGETLTRAALVARVEAQIAEDAPDGVAPAPRRIAALLLELAANYGLRERLVKSVSADGAPTRSRGFVYDPSIIPATETTPEEEPMNAPAILSEAAALRERADARAYDNDELTRHLELLERQRAAYASGDLRTALTALHERHSSGVLIDATTRFTQAA